MRLAFREAIMWWLDESIQLLETVTTESNVCHAFDEMLEGWQEVLRHHWFTQFARGMPKTWVDPDSAPRRDQLMQSVLPALYQARMRAEAEPHTSFLICLAVTRAAVARRTNWDEFGRVLRRTLG